MRYVISLPTGWTRAHMIDAITADGRGPHSPKYFEVKINIPTGCKIMVDAGVRLLSLANQLHSSSRRVTLDFEEAMTGTMGYLNRLGFFDHLDSGVEVLPSRPDESGAKIYRGKNTELVEIASINPKNKDQALPSRLADTIELAMTAHPNRKAIGLAAFTIFGELIDNVFQHSSSLLDGYAALQVYGGRSRQAMVVVSDSGRGLMETLRPSLCTEYPALQHLSDPNLLLETFRQGISRHGQGRGCGLKRCAETAIKYKSAVEVRLPQARVLLTPKHDRYELDSAECEDGLPLLWGTHFCFTFQLDVHEIT